MFRRRWSGLPEDPDFPTDLTKLGYFINEADEIRSIANPNDYFNYFVDKNPRVNDRLRFAFTIAVVDIIHARLRSLGLIRVANPLSATHDNDKPHRVIFCTPNLPRKKRIIVIFGETNQDLGVLAHRVIARKGGIDEGSMVSIVKALLSNNAKDEFDEEDVGIILANSGESWWWSEGKRALCYRQSMNVKMASAAHKGIAYNPVVHAIPGNEDLDAHVKYVFEHIIDNASFLGAGMGLPDKENNETVQIVGIAEGAVAVEKYLDATWERWDGKVGCLALVGDGLAIGEVKNEGFKRFLGQRARAYITTSEDVGTPIANSTGNPATLTFTNYGCPVLASGENYYSELTLIKAKGHILPWLNEVYKAGKDYVSPIMDVTFRDESFAPTDQWPEEWTKSLKGKRGEAKMMEWEKELEEAEGRKEQNKEEIDKHSEQDKVVVAKEKQNERDESAERKERDQGRQMVDFDATPRASGKQVRVGQETVEGDTTRPTVDMQARCEDADDEDDGAKAFV